MENRIPSSGNRAGSTSGIIDAHVHVWTPDRKNFPRDPQYSGPEYRPASFTVDEFLIFARSSGVKRAVLVQMSFYGTDNAYLLQAIENHPGLFSGIAVVDERSPAIESELIDLHSRGVRGFRIECDRDGGNLQTESMKRLWRLAAERRMAICPLVGPEAIAALDRMCADYPETLVVVDHMARIGIDSHIKPEEVQVLCGLARHPRVFVKISAFYALGQKKYPYLDLILLIHALYDAFGASRLMWGSDAPFQAEAPHTYAGSIELVRDRLDFLTQAGREWLLGKTAEKIFF